MPYSVYILYSVKLDKYYTGSCADICIRLTQHNAGRNISTSAGRPWILKYREEYAERSLAVKREYAIKKKESEIYCVVN